MKIAEFTKKVKSLFSLIKLGQQPLSNGQIVQYDGDALEVGSVVYLLDKAGDWSILPDGSYLTKSNIQFAVKDGEVLTLDDSQYNPAPAIPSEKVPQAQSSDKEAPKSENQNSNSESMKTDKTNPSTKSKFDGDASDGYDDQVGDVTSKDTEDTKDADDSKDDAAQDAAQLQAALAPVWEAIKAIQAQLSDCAGKVATATEEFKKVGEKFAILEKTPAAGPIEGSVNPLTKNTPKDIKETFAYKIMSAK